MSVFVRPVIAAASTGGSSAKGAGEGGDKDKDKDKIGGGLLLGKKRARLLPDQPFEKVTPEAGERERAARWCFMNSLAGG